MEVVEYTHVPISQMKAQGLITIQERFPRVADVFVPFPSADFYFPHALAFKNGIPIQVQVILSHQKRNFAFSSLLNWACQFPYMVLLLSAPVGLLSLDSELGEALSLIQTLKGPASVQDTSRPRPQHKGDVVSPEGHKQEGNHWAGEMVRERDLPQTDKELPQNREETDVPHRQMAVCKEKKGRKPGRDSLKILLFLSSFENIGRTRKGSGVPQL